MAPTTPQHASPDAIRLAAIADSLYALLLNLDEEYLRARPRSNKQGGTVLIWTNGWEAARTIAYERWQVVAGQVLALQAMEQNA